MKKLIYASLIFLLAFGGIAFTFADDETQSVNGVTDGTIAAATTGTAVTPAATTTKDAINPIAPIASASMKFTGTPIKLSLDTAVKTMQSTGPGFEAAVISKQFYEAASKSSKEALDSLTEMGASKNTAAGKSATLARAYYNKYAPVAYEASMNNLEKTTVQAYYGILQAQENYRIAAETSNIKQTLLTQVQKKYNLGVVSKMDVLLVQNDTIDAKNQVQSALTSLNSAKMSFNMALGYDLMQSITLTDTLKMVSAPKIDLTKSINSALKNRGEILTAKYNLDSADFDFKSVSAYPNNSATYLNKKAAYQSSQMSYDNTLLSIEMEVRNAYMRITDLKNSVTLSQSTYNNAKEAARLAGLQYNAGMSTLTDLQTAQNNAYKAQLGLYAAITQYDLAIYDFNYMIGAGAGGASGGAGAGAGGPQQ